MEKSVSLQILEAIDVANKKTDRGELVNINLTFTRGKSERTASLILKALQEDKIPSNVLRLAYENAKGFLENFLIDRLYKQQSVSSDISLSLEERMYLYKQVIPATLRMALATMPLVTEDPRTLAQQLEVTQRNLNLYTTHPELMEALFEDAYADAVVELTAEITREAVMSVTQPPDASQLH